MAIDEDVEQLALDANDSSRGSATTAFRPSTCSSPTADGYRLGVLHYDRDYDLIAEKADLDSAAAGSPRRARSDTNRAASACELRTARAPRYSA